MPDDRGRLTHREFRAALDQLDETQSSFARLLVQLGDTAEDKDRTVQRWASGERDVPGPVTALLRVLAIAQEHGITGDAIRGILAEGHPAPWQGQLAGAVVLQDRRRR